jgi:ADP-ribosylglycohydrolase
MYAIFKRWLHFYCHNFTFVSGFEHRQKKEKEWKKMKRQEMDFTDDTAMARSIAESLVQHNSVNVKDIAQR